MHDYDTVFFCSMLERLPNLPHVGEDLVSLLQKCRQEKNLLQAKHLLASMLEHQLDTHVVFGSLLVSTLVDCGCLLDAQSVFDKLPHRSEYSWTFLILGYINCGDPQHAFHLYHEMLQDSVQPKCYTYVALLKACTRLMDVDFGQALHSEIVTKGLDANKFIANILIDLYGKCRLLLEARHVLDKLPNKDAVSWTALISGYAGSSLVDHALSCLKQMQAAGVSPVSATFVCSLKACGIVGCIEKSQSLHDEVTKRAFETDVFVGSTMVDVYAKCGLLEEAQQVFNQICVKNAVLWNTMIAGYVEHGRFEEALRFFEQMQLGGISATDITFIWSLKACTSIADKEKGHVQCAEIVKKAFDKDPFVGSAMVDMYVNCGSLMEARHVLDQLPLRNAVTWNALLGGYAEQGLAKKTLTCYKQMQLEGISPDAVTFACSLKACSIIRALETGKEVHVGLVKSGFDRELIVGNTLVDMYAKCDSLVDARKVFDMLSIRDAVSWATLIAGYAEHEFDEEVLNCFHQMQLAGTLGDDVTLVLCLKACGTLGSLGIGRGIHAMVKKSGLEGDLFVGNTLLDMYGKCGSVVEGREVFDKMRVRDVVTWNAMIKCYGENHKADMAIRCFEDMQEQDVKPDAITFTCLLAACSHASLLLKGQEYFMNMIEEYQIEPTLDHYTCLVDLLGRSGHIMEAELYAEAMQCLPFKELPKTLLTACKVYGEVEMGEKCFQQLVKVDQKDAAPYLLLAGIYASVGRSRDASTIEETRVCAGAKKKLASACIEVNKSLHEFIVGASQCKHLLAILDTLRSQLNDGGYVPSVDLVLSETLRLHT